ncbi:MAG: histidine phosphatase family protein [Cyanobacteria bacterium P01_D01_bin.105]
MTYLKLLLIRHAQSLGNVQKIMEGQSSTALSVMGQHQAKQLAHWLQTSTNLPTHLYSSPLMRAQQTAEAIATALSATQHSFIYTETTALHELHLGIFQGLTWPQAQVQYPDLCRQLMATLTWCPIPQAETPLAARNRAQSWFNHILNSHAAGDVIWAVSHEGFLQHLIAVVMGCDHTWKIQVAHTAIFEFWRFHPTASQSAIADEATDGCSCNLDCSNPDDFNPELWMLHRFNDCQHLSEHHI